MASHTASAELAGTFLEVMAYGVYITLVPRAYMVLRRRGFQGLLIKYLHATFILIMLTNTLHVSIDVGRVIHAFTTHTDQLGFAEAYLSRFDSPLSMTKMACGLVVFALADGLIVLRTYIVWERSYKVIIVPAIFLLSDIAHSVQLVVVLSKNSGPNLTHSLIVFSAISWALNLLCSGLIAYKLLKARKILDQCFSMANNRLNNALTIIVESALVYSIISLGALISTVLGTSSIFIFIDMMPPLVGIVFLYVIISGSNFGPSVATHQTSTISDALAARRHSYASSDHRLELGTRPHSPRSGVVVQISLDRTVHTDDPESLTFEK